MNSETIFALSSGAGVAGVAVVRISGPKAFEVLTTLTQKPLPENRRAVVRRLIDPQSQALLDQALVLTFKGPGSFTGEDVVELHIHGGPAVVNGVLSALGAQSDLRTAEPGEFSRRAFEAGKLDLTEVEGLGDLLQAQTAAQREQALRQMDGALSEVYENWRSRLVKYLAHLEADIDFPDEDLPEGVAGAILPKIIELKSDIESHLSDAHRGERLREGYRIVILGEPNAGKSTLLNHLAASDVAIVTDEAGTTRDILDIQLDLGGFPVRLLDTAGVRDGDIGQVEAEGIRRAEKQASQADLRLVLVRADEWPRVPERLLPWLDGAFLLVTQTDRVTDTQDVFHVEQIQSQIEGQSETTIKLAGVWPVSVHDGQGLPEFLTAVEGHVEQAMGLREAPALTRARHREALTDAVEALSRFPAQAGIDAVLAAEEVRLAARSLGRITGRVGVEDLLDVIFHDFCIGK